MMNILPKRGPGGRPKRPGLGLSVSSNAPTGATSAPPFAPVTFRGWVFSFVVAVATLRTRQQNVSQIALL